MLAMGNRSSLPSVILFVPIRGHPLLWLSTVLFHIGVVLCSKPMSRRAARHFCTATTTGMCRDSPLLSSGRTQRKFSKCMEIPNAERTNLDYDSENEGRVILWIPTFWATFQVCDRRGKKLRLSRPYLVQQLPHTPHPRLAISSCLRRTQ